MSRRKRSKNSGTVKAKKKGRNKGTRRSQKRNKQSMGAMLDWFLPDGSIFSKMRFHGNTKWLPKLLVGAGTGFRRLCRRPILDCRFERVGLD
jgi:hypothetical protein